MMLINQEYTKQRGKVIITTLLCLFLQVRKTSSAVSTCGGTLTGETGTFTSPNYPHSPESSKHVITCEWKIIVPKGLGIQLNFGDFDMAAGLDECGKGELEVFAGIDDEKSSLDKYCGSDDLDTVQLKTHSATVIFRRPKHFSGKGFLASYIATKPRETISDFVTCVDRGSDHKGADSYSVLCPGGCANITDFAVRGKTTYRDDAYLCRAAVHAGIISDSFGGRIEVKRVPGKEWYLASEANGISTETGALSATMIQFVRPDEDCRENIEFHENQLTASTFWTRDPKDQDKTKWKPDNAIMGKQVNSWSPNNPTTEQWLQVDLKEPKVITAISTRGSMETYYKSESYRIAYRNDTKSSWTFYKEEGMSEPKVFVGNLDTFKETRNNFIRPRIVGRFFRIYPTPVSSDNYRYSIQFALFGCDSGEKEDVVEPPVVSPTASSTTKSTTISTKSTTLPSSSQSTDFVKPISVPVNEGNSTIRSTESNGSSIIERDELTTGGVVKVSITPTGDKKSTINESSIIVIAIVAALGVTSMLLAALVLLLVKKRKKVPKNGPPASYQMQQIQDNNNTGFPYKSKKRRKRSRKNPGELFQNPDYNPLMQAQNQPPPPMVPSQFPTMPADQPRFVAEGPNNNSMPAFMRNGVMPQHNSFHPQDETDSFITDDDDHEYQDIPDVSDGRTPVPSVGRGSSKASTGSSLGNHSRKSDTVQRQWGVDGNQWNKAPFSPNSPIFYTQQHNGNPHNPNVSTFTGSHPHETFFYPGGPKNHPVGRSNTFHESRSSPIGENHPHIRRGSSQSPSHFQRHSSSSNNSSHSYPQNGVSYNHQDPYYSSVPNGENGNPIALNHGMYGGETIPEQNELPASATKRAPSYKVPKQFSLERPALPEKIGNAIIQAQGSNNAIAISGRSTSPAESSMRSDYDRLYRNNSTVSAPDQKNNFSIFNGSHSQYNQLDLNSERV